jgi:hypothetical protein
MITPVDEQLRHEAERFRFRFSCESCCHYDPERDRCGNGYPHQAHRGIRLQAAPEVVFCKEFELS